MLLVMVAASLAARVVASSRSMKISANIRASLGERLILGPMFPCRCDGHHKMSCGREYPPLLRSAVWPRSCDASASTSARSTADPERATTPSAGVLAPAAESARGILRASAGSQRKGEGSRNGWRGRSWRRRREPPGRATSRARLKQNRDHLLTAAPIFGTNDNVFNYPARNGRELRISCGIFCGGSNALPARTARAVPPISRPAPAPASPW